MADWRNKYSGLNWGDLYNEAIGRVAPYSDPGYHGFGTNPDSLGGPLDHDGSYESALLDTAAGGAPNTGYNLGYHGMGKDGIFALLHNPASKYGEITFHDSSLPDNLDVALTRGSDGKASPRTYDTTATIGDYLQALSPILAPLAVATSTGAAGGSSLGSGVSLGNGGVTGVTGTAGAGGLGAGAGAGLGFTTAGAGSSLGSLGSGYFGAEGLTGLGAGAGAALSSGASAGGTSASGAGGELAVDGSDQLANEAAKLAAQNSAPPGSLLDTTLPTVSTAESGGALQSVVDAVKKDPRLLISGANIIGGLLKGGSQGGSSSGALSAAPSNYGGAWSPTQQQWANQYFNSLPSREINQYQGDLSRAPITGGEHMWFSQPSAQPQQNQIAQSSGLSQLAQSMPSQWLNNGTSHRDLAFAGVDKSDPRSVMMARGGQVKGALSQISDGQSDDVPIMASRDEFMIPADVVSALGSGSSSAGAEALHGMMRAVRQHHRSVGSDDVPPRAKSPLEYLRDGMKGQ